MQDYPQDRAAPYSGLDDLREAIYQHTIDFQGENLIMLEGVRQALEQLPADTVVVADMTMIGYAAAQCLPMRQPRTFIHPSEFAQLAAASHWH